ncbi:ABC transporter permease [Streptococcus suis]|uniref:ABC transporter permease n=1 Tax=Streptococcus suis TaxID=1307 RepID=UPI0005BB5861|nr:ABC transporter permease [Streptococcus suis]MCQ8272362.1 FtsX-like permease family protein [Streptococcus suis]MDW8721221.1 FtsX-like permease family protein [Streptococcus suis]MDY7597444.1 FtsX-like permease family protein [Streptococcus suis]RRR49599.1 ABC transporter permease [Streptococcus suis]UUM50104.1 FtsX-like permease family protein [Streptococcus suis]
MKKKIYWKDMRQSLLSSKGRFLSIFSLMMLGALALTGLKVTAPNMEKTAQAYIASHRTMDLAVISGLGLSQADLDELETIEGATLEAGYFKDVVTNEGQTAIRLFSAPKTLSTYKLVEGEMPSQKGQIALSASFKNRYKLDDTVQVTESDKDGKILTQTSFTLVGFVASAEIWDNETMGMAASGDGQLGGYGLVSQDTFKSEVYTIARIRYDDLVDLPYYSQAYQDRLDQHQEDLEKLLADNDEQRLETIQAEGQTEIDKGEAEISQAQSQLDQAAGELASGKDQLASGRSEFARGRAKLVQSEMELRTVLAQLLQTKFQLDESKKELDNQKDKLDQSKSFLDVSHEGLLETAQRLESAKQQLDSQNAQLSQTASQISTGRASWFQAQKELDLEIANHLQEGQTLSDYPDLLARQEGLDVEKSRLDQMESAHEQANQAYLQGYDYYQTKQNEYNSNLAQYQTWNQEYQAGLARYQAGLSQYEQGIAAYNKGVEDYEWGLSQLESSNQLLRQEELRLEEADKELSQAQSQFSEKKATADQEISQAQTEIAQAKSDLSKLEKAPYQVYTRSSLPGGDGYTTYSNATRSIAAVGNVFPVVLYLVAALVTFTTMARFVDEERTQSGLLKALGYTNRQIMAKFILYGLAAGLVGTIVGIIAGNLLLSPLISDIITQTTVIGPAKLHFYPLWTGLALLLSLASSVLPAYLVARRELTEKPAQLLLPKPPVTGSSIWLEKWPAIWSRLSFTHKVTARNIFRYKLRMLMTIFGVAGTVALLFGGLGIRSSISGVVQRQFGELIHYDMLVVENSRATEEELDKLTHFLQSDQVRQSLPVAFEQLNQTVEENGQRKNLSISLYISDRRDFGNQVSLESSTGQPIKLSDRGIVLTEKLAQIYGVSVGDKLSLTLEDKEVSVRVEAVADMYAGHFIYMTRGYYEQVTGKQKTANAYLVQLKDSQLGHIQTLASQLLAMPAVRSLVQNTSLIDMLTTIAGSLQTIMTILVILSILLGLVILYNLTIINMSERIRELSTIKVLGFHNKEVTMYIYRETIALSLIGMLVGLVGGIYLHKLLLAMIGSDSIRFNPSVGLEVYLIPILAISGILAALGWYVNHHLRKVDMLEALKSVD